MDPASLLAVSVAEDPDDDEVGSFIKFLSNHIVLSGYSEYFRYYF